MAQMVVIYRTPADREAFNKHYFEIHIPLAKSLPGLESYEVSTGPVVALASATDAYLIGTLRFPSMEALKAAFASECGRACAADRQLMASDDMVQMFLFDDRLV